MASGLPSEKLPPLLQPYLPGRILLDRDNFFFSVSPRRETPPHASKISFLPFFSSGRRDSPFFSPPAIFVFPGWRSRPRFFQINGVDFRVRGFPPLLVFFVEVLLPVPSFVYVRPGVVTSRFLSLRSRDPVIFSSDVIVRVIAPGIFWLGSGDVVLFLAKPSSFPAPSFRDS